MALLSLGVPQHVFWDMYEAHVQDLDLLLQGGEGALKVRPLTPVDPVAEGFVCDVDYWEQNSDSFTCPETNLAVSHCVASNAKQGISCSHGLAIGFKHCMQVLATMGCTDPTGNTVSYTHLTLPTKA